MHVEVFLSYSRDDDEFANQIKSKLDDHGIRVWWDNKISRDSSDYASEIEKAIHAAQCVLVLWSKNTRNSEWVRGEAALGKELSKLLQVSLDGENGGIRFKLGQCTQLNVNETTIADSSLCEVVNGVKNMIGIQGPMEHLIRANVVGKGWNFGDLAIETPVPGLDFYVSFRPCGDSGVFLLRRLDTTDGWVQSNIPSAVERHEPYMSDEVSAYKDNQGKEFLKVKNDVFYIMDPLRPYGIQIGGLRSKRPSAKPGAISGDIPIDQLKILPIDQEWVCMTLAEILSTEESLSFLWNKVSKLSEWSDESKRKIERLISRNPNAPLTMQKSMCPFCDKIFMERRKLSSLDKEKKYGASVIANDFPFGPNFHYLVIIEEPVHSWEKLSYKQINGLNLMMYDFVQNHTNTQDVAGVLFGFNSTVRHLILGSKTQSSAGASIPHIHKQVWGMAQKNPNISEHLIKVSQAYWDHNVDYQGAYIKALREAGYIIWEDGNVVLYVPYGQSSKYEIQAMVINPTGCLLDLSIAEVESLSKAEYIAMRLFISLEIESFNQVVLSKVFNDTRAPKFRLVEAFITREVDLAVSELSMLYVIDQHPWESRNEIMSKWETMKDVLLKEIN